MALTPDISMNDIGGSTLDYTKSLNSSENNALNSYTMAQRAQAKPLDIYTSLENNAGLPQMKQTAATLRGQVGSLEDSIRRVEPDVTARTQNSLVTEAQRRGMVTAGQYPLQQTLAPLSEGLGRIDSAIQSAGSDIATKTGLVLQGNQQELDPYQKQLQLTQEQNTRALSGFTSDKETQLNLLMDKLQRDRTLSDREWQQAADLAKIKQSYDNSVSLAKFNNQLPQNQYMSVGTTGLFNPATGKYINPYGTGSSDANIRFSNGQPAIQSNTQDTWSKV